MRRDLLTVSGALLLLLVAVSPVPVESAAASTVVTASGSGGQSSPATKAIVRDAQLETKGQNLWGGDEPSIATVELFDESWNASGELGGTERVCVGIPDVWEECGRFGAEITGSVSGSISMAIELAGLEGGELDVTYPVSVEFTAPADNSFDPGDTIEILTALSVDADNARINARFPALDSIAWLGGFGLDAEASSRVCFVSCDNRNLFNSRGTDDLINGEILRVPDPRSVDGCINFLLAIALGLGKYPSGRCDDGGFLFNPDVKVSTAVNPDGTLSASGSDLYGVFPVSGVTWAFRPTPLPWWAALNLGPSTYKGTTLGWNSFDTLITALETMRQDLLFDPTVEVTLDWGDDRAFEVVDGTTGAIVAAATGSAATLRVGDTLRLTTPAVGSKVIPIVPTVAMAAATMTNHTRSVSSGNAELKALAFVLETDRERVCFEGECLTLWPSTKTNEGPLYRQNFPLGRSGETLLFNDTFDLGGFNAVELEAFDLVPRPVVEVRKALVPDIAPGAFDLLIDDETRATDVRDGGTTGRVVVEPGTRVISEAEGSVADLRYYDITITCRHYDDGEIHTASAGSAPGLGSSMGLVLTGGEDLICTVQNRLPVPAECDSMTFDNVILGTPGADVADRLIGTTGNNMIVGYGGNDTLIGGAGDDCLAGNSGHNIINGGAGNNNIIDGGTGTSICTAGIIMRNCTITGPRQ
jgi:hypothetical protein